MRLLSNPPDANSVAAYRRPTPSFITPPLPSVVVVVAAGPSSKMMTPLRYVVLVLGIIISLHYILSFTHEGYGQATSIGSIKQKIGGSGSHVPPYKVPLAEDYYVKPNVTSPQGRKANATIVMLGERRHLNARLCLDWN